MLKIRFGLALLAIIMAEPALAQNYNRNFLECAKQLGAVEDVRPSGDHLRMFHFNSEQQHIAFMDCVARKAKETPAATTKRPQRSPQ
jgi:hypothetical protein